MDERILSEQIKDALAAVDDGIGTESYGQVKAAVAALAVIRSALEAAQQEAEAWEVIELLCRAKQYFYEGYCRQRGSFKGHAFRITEGDDTVLFRVDGETRLKALVDAAAWCRAEMTR